MLDKLISMLANHPVIIQKIADNRLIRQAAKFTAYLFINGKGRLDKTLPKWEQSIKNVDTTRFNRMKDTFVKEMDKEMKNLKNKKK